MFLFIYVLKFTLNRDCLDVASFVRLLRSVRHTAVEVLSGRVKFMELSTPFAAGAAKAVDVLDDDTLVISLLRILSPVSVVR